MNSVSLPNCPPRLLLSDDDIFSIVHDEIEEVLTMTAWGDIGTILRLTEKTREYRVANVVRHAIRVGGEVSLRRASELLGMPEPELRALMGIERFEDPQTTMLDPFTLAVRLGYGKTAAGLVAELLNAKSGRAA